MFFPDLLAKKCAETRVFSDENDRLNLSVKDIHGGILVIPNFTLYGNCKHGRRPEFLEAAKPEIAKPLFDYFADLYDKGAFITVLGDYVTTEDGCGIVHTASGFGEDDYNAGKKYNIAVVNPVDEEGKYTAINTISALASYPEFCESDPNDKTKKEA